MSKAIIFKELVALNVTTINYCLEVVAYMSSLEFPETVKIISTIIDDNRILHVFACILHKCSHDIRKTCLFLLSNMVLNSQEDALKILKHPELMEGILKSFSPKTAL